MKPSYKVDLIEDIIPFSAGGYTLLYQAKGRGQLHGFLIEMNTDRAEIRLSLDNVIVFQGLTTAKIKKMNFYIKNKGAMYQNRSLFCTNGNDFDFTPPYPLGFEKSITIEVKHSSPFNVETQLYSITREDGQ